MQIRLLTVEDVGAYVALRREMLADSPWAFASGPGDDLGLDAAVVAGRVSQPGQAIVGAWDENGALAGAAGLFLQRQAKMSHRAHVWGVYVTPRARGQGVGERLVRRVLEVACSWPGVTSAGLSVSVRSAEARRVYERAGFRAWGIEPGALIVDGTAFDEIHMVADLRGADPANRGAGRG